MDFKGYFRCGNRERCDPFTITDAYSRYLIRCQAVPKLDFEHVDAICDAAMREYGLPERIRTDNGIPFATTSVRGLSRLSVKWMKLGITHERIEPGEPQQNGRHERMRRYPSTIPEPTYSSQFDVRRVRNVGHIKLQGGYVFVSEMLRHELVGLLQIEENRYEVYFGNLLLGEVDTDWMTMTRVR
jgi:transposase InsO family protein